MAEPTRITPTGTADYLAVLTKAIFHAGMTWAVVEGKWPGFEAAFAGFDPARVAAFTPADVERLATDPNIIRNQRKIVATVTNAQVMLDLEERFGGIEQYLQALGDFRRSSLGCGAISNSSARPAPITSCTSWASRCPISPPGDPARNNPSRARRRAERGLARRRFPTVIA